MSTVSACQVRAEEVTHLSGRACRGAQTSRRAAIYGSKSVVLFRQERVAAPGLYWVVKELSRTAEAHIKGRLLQTQKNSKPIARKVARLGFPQL